MEIDEQSSLPYLCYRCYRCGTLLTRTQIRKKWAKAEGAALCACGSRHISPSNTLLREELTRPDIWWLWLTDVVWPWLKSKF